jgi:chromosome segregation ATPase
MQDRGFACGIQWVEKDGTKRACTHESRRDALDCTRRLAAVGVQNQLEQAQHDLKAFELDAQKRMGSVVSEKDAEIAKLQKANEGYIANVNALSEELNRCKAVLEATMKDKDTLIAQISELELAKTALTSQLDAITSSGSQWVTQKCDNKLVVADPLAGVPSDNHTNTVQTEAESKHE